MENVEPIHTKPGSIPNNPTNYLTVEGTGMVRSTSQSFSPLRPNLPQDFLKKQQNEQNLVKHILNHKIYSNIYNSEECSPSPNHMHSFSDIGTKVLSQSPQNNKFSPDLSSTSTDTLVNVDDNDINKSLLEIELLKNRLMSIKVNSDSNNNNNKNYKNQELDNAFINDYLCESNVLSNNSNSPNPRNRSSNNSSNNNSPVPNKKVDYMENLHLKIQSEIGSPSKLSKNFVVDDEENYFKIQDNEEDKDKTIVLPKYQNHQSVKPINPVKPINTKVKIISKCKNFPSQTIDLKNRYSLGRNNSENKPYFIVFNSLVVSRYHAELFMENNKIYIIDVGSNGGTFINGKKISNPGIKSEPVQVLPGDVIQLGQDYVENDKNQQLDESVYKCVVFELAFAETLEARNKKLFDSIIDVYSISDSGIVRTQSDTSISKRTSTDYNNYNNIINENKNNNKRGKTKELYDITVIDESTKYQLELYEKTKNLNDEYSNVNSHLLDNIKEACLQFFFVIYSDKKKLNKIQILNENTECIFEVTLKDWSNKRIKYDDEHKGKMHIMDKREEFSPTSSIKVNKVGRMVNVTAENYQLGYIENISDMKYIIETPGQSGNAPQFCLTGDFEQHNWLCITKFKDSRKQRCIGEAKGKQLVEKSTKQRKWVVSVQLETGNYSQLLLSAVTYIIALTGPYY